MSKGRTSSVVARFRITQDDGELWADLEDVSPKGRFGISKGPQLLIGYANPDEYRCAYCHPAGSRFQRILNDDPFVAGNSSRHLCDACCVQEHVSCVGAEDVLEQAGVELKPGVVQLKGYMEWSFWDSPDGDDDCDEEFIPEEIAWLVGVEEDHDQVGS